MAGESPQKKPHRKALKITKFPFLNYTSLISQKFPHHRRAWCFASLVSKLTHFHLKCKLTVSEAISSKIILKKQNVLCVGVVQCVCQRQRDRGKRRERGNYSGRNNVHLWPCVGKMLPCLCVCVCVSKYSRLVWLLSALTCIPFFSLSTVFLTLSFSWAHFSLTLPLPLGLISPPHPPTQCTQHCKSARQHKCTHTHTHKHAIHARIHTHTRARKHTHSQREVLLGSAGCVALPVLTLYLLLYLYPLSILYANLCMFTFCILHPHSSPNARRTFMVPLAFILSR